MTSTSVYKSYRLIFAVLAISLLACGLRLLLWRESLDLLDGKFIADDSYIALEIAKQIALGNGPRFSAFMTNGFQPLYVGLMALIFHSYNAESLLHVAVLDQVVKQALLLNIGFSLLSIALLAYSLKLRQQQSISIIIACLLWGLHPFGIAISLNGLETTIAVCGLLLVDNQLIKLQQLPSAWWRSLCMGLALGLATLARIDLLATGLFIGWHYLHQLELQGWSRRFIIMLVNITIGFSVMIIPWLVYSDHYTGLWFQISGRSLHLITHSGNVDITSWQFFKRAISILFSKAPVLWSLTALIHSIMIWTPYRREFYRQLQRYSLLISFGPLLLVVYTCYIGDFWYYDRYFFTTLFIPILTIVCCIDSLSAADRKPFAKLSTSVLLLLTTLVLFSNPGFIEIYTKQRGSEYRYMGLWARANLPAGTQLAAGQSGALAYYATQLTVINLDGIVSEPAFKALQDQQLWRFMQQQRADYVLDWPAVIGNLIAKCSDPHVKRNYEIIQMIAPPGQAHRPWVLVRPIFAK